MFHISQSYTTAYNIITVNVIQKNILVPLIVTALKITHEILKFYHIVFILGMNKCSFYEPV